MTCDAVVAWNEKNNIFVTFQQYYHAIKLNISYSQSFSHLPEVWVFGNNVIRAAAWILNAFFGVWFPTGLHIQVFLSQWQSSDFFPYLTLTEIKPVFDAISLILSLELHSRKLHSVCIGPSGLHSPPIASPSKVIDADLSTELSGKLPLRNSTLMVYTTLGFTWIRSSESWLLRPVAAPSSCIIFVIAPPKLKRKDILTLGKNENRFN